VKNEPGRRRLNDDDVPSSDTSLVMGLSLFIILLAFFIVMGSLSTYTPVKVGDAFDSINLAFSEIVISSEFHKQSMQNDGSGMGKGDSIKELGAGLRSILPNLNIQTDPRPDGGKTMFIRMKKDDFDTLSKTMIPLLIRILNEKDTAYAHGLTLVSYVRNPFDRKAKQSLTVLDRNAQKIIDQGLPKYKMSIRMERGNPAFMAFQFDFIPKQASMLGVN
jgi:hypothetical protein